MWQLTDEVVSERTHHCTANVLELNATVELVHDLTLLVSDHDQVKSLVGQDQGARRQLFLANEARVNDNATLEAENNFFVG